MYASVAAKQPEDSVADYYTNTCCVCTKYRNFKLNFPPNNAQIL
jgi:hypothetical protein